MKGKNPFKDKRVRQAFYQAIDIEAIQKAVMRGASTPTALMVAPGINGFPADLNKRLPYDRRSREEAAGRSRLSERLRSRHELPERPLRQRRGDLPGGGGEPGAHRRQDQPDGRDQGHLFPEDPARDTSFYLLGWTPGTYDAHNALICADGNARTTRAQGQFNLGAYSNPKLDELTMKIPSETDIRPSATR